MANQRTLIRLSQAAEDVASGLNIFRDSLPSQATHLTAIISELYAVSSTLRKLDGAAQVDSRQEPSFYRIKDDLRIVLQSLNYTLDDALRMFARARERPVAMVWGDLEHRMKEEEGARFGERLEWCNEYLDDLYAGLDGYPSDRVGLLRRRIRALLETQESFRVAGRRPSAIDSSASTPRPGPSRNSSYRPVDVPISPISDSDSWNYSNRGFPPTAPEVPPLSPTYTSSSSHTMDSSHTSYSSGFVFDPMAVAPPPPIHWARDVFDGGSPSTLFRGNHQLDDDTKCYGTPYPEATRRLDDDGFISVVEIDFDRGAVQVRLYWRPADNRSRILFMAKDSRRRELLYCVPLTGLRALRKESCIQLCRASREDGRFHLWANLNFIFYERMVLFYSTFVAMKRQDNREALPVSLIEDLDLREEEQFGGVIRDGGMLHALRLFWDRKSGVVRLEGSPLRGPKEGVPLWTAFITRYAIDPDWMALEDDGQVSMIALKPPPYVFLAGYKLPRNRKGEYILQFETPDDADEFVKTWNGFCRSSSR